MLVVSAQPLSADFCLDLALCIFSLCIHILVVYILVLILHISDRVYARYYHFHVPPSPSLGGLEKKRVRFFVNPVYGGIGAGHTKVDPHFFGPFGLYV